MRADGSGDYEKYDEAREHRYRKARGDDDTGRWRWASAAFSSLIVAAVIGLWSQNAQMAEMRADIRNLKEQIERLSRLIEPRYREPQR